MFRSVNNDKIGNVLVYFAQHIPYLPMTKAIKLLFILDELSVKETGVPITWLEYSAWKMGPVPAKLYDELKNGEPEVEKGKSYSISDFVEVQTYSEGSDVSVNLEAKKEFDPDEFCEYEIELMDRVVKEYGNLTGAHLIDFTHSDDGLWKKTVEQHDLDRFFRHGQYKTPNIIDIFSHVDSADRFASLLAAMEAMQIQTHMNSNGG